MDITNMSCDDDLVSTRYETSDEGALEQGEVDVNNRRLVYIS